MGFTRPSAVTGRRVSGSALVILQLLLSIAGRLPAQETRAPTNRDPDAARGPAYQRHRALTFTTEAYRKEALRLLAEEATRVASELHLPEKLPIVQTNLLETYISPPAMSQAMGTFGTVTTSNYTYYISVGNRFSFLTKRNLGADNAHLRAQYQWAMDRLDTNAAFQLATQFLAAASMDVAALNRDCTVKIRAFTPEGVAGKHFVPVYWVTWIPKQRVPMGSGAEIELFEPTKELRQMHVLNEQYIHRRPLRVSNLAELISQTNAPPSSSPPGKQ